MSAINLSPGGIPIGDAGSRTLEPNSALDVNDGDEFHVGDFVLVFHLQETGSLPAFETAGLEAPSTGGASASSPIGVRIQLPQLSLSPDIPLDGIIYVCNQGTATGVQFYLQLEGLPQDCYEIAPAPILFPGAEKGVPFRLHHPKRPDYLAGPHKIVIRAQAIDAYPGINSTVSREVRVLPYYNHSLRILS